MQNDAGRTATRADTINASNSRRPDGWLDNIQEGGQQICCPPFLAIIDEVV